MAIEIITGTDLVGVPGVTGTTDELSYAARRASTLVESHWCNPVDPAPQWVKDIAVDAAARYLANPRGVTSVTRTRSVDDASRSETDRFESGAVAGGGIALTDDEIARLCPKIRRQVGTIRLGVPGYC